MMVRVLVGALLGAAALSAAQAADVGVSLQFSEPGVFGRVDIGQFPQPQLLAPRPVLIAPPVGAPPPEPVYLWVPPEHRAHWREHCREYHACGHPVYFVDHDWYKKNVIAHAHDHDHDRHEHEHGDHDHGDRDHGDHDHGDHGHEHHD